MNKTSLFIVVVVIIGSIAGLIALGSNLVVQVVGTTELDVDVGIQVSGNDIIITVHGGKDVYRVAKIHVRIEGGSSTYPNIDRSQFEGKKPVVCTDLAKGVKGNRFVIVEGTLTDESTALIEYHRITFT